jgi:cytoskeletal protein RodZ
MLSVGETLKRARLAQGLDLATFAARTKINVKYLEAIESDDRNDFPSGFFYKSFVAQYAKCLAMDTREIDAEIDRILSADAPLPLPGYESVVARNVSPLKVGHRFHYKRAFGLAATLILVVGGCSGVYTLWRTGRLRLPAPEVKAKPASPVLAKTALPPVKPEAPAEKVAAVPAPPPERTEPAEATPANYKVMLDLLAHEATWLSVSSDGKPVFSGILQANESKVVGGKQFAKMRVGNAAGLEVRLNGKLLGPLGARGQVLEVLFTPDNFQIVAPRESD